MMLSNSVWPPKLKYKQQNFLFNNSHSTLVLNSTFPFPHFLDKVDTSMLIIEDQQLIKMHNHPFSSHNLLLIYQEENKFLLLK
jgi:hypothetical protein